ncbi:unnamed protein product, partial [Prorocentrum cordatum]
MDIPSHFAEGKALQIGEFADEGGRNSDERLDYLLMDILPHLPQDKAYPPPMRAEPPHEADQLLSRLGETEMSQVALEHALRRWHEPASACEEPAPEPEHAGPAGAPSGGAAMPRGAA